MGFPSELLWGEQQWVAIGRAIAKKSPVLLWTNPPEISTQKVTSVVSALYNTSKKLWATTVVVTHVSNLNSQNREHRVWKPSSETRWWDVLWIYLSLENFSSLIHSEDSPFCWWILPNQKITNSIFKFLKVIFRNFIRFCCIHKRLDLCIDKR